tara:strand:+ start:204 stop:335 length:132 start_codon:yes stop_codon:yes gene_type:complete
MYSAFDCFHLIWNIVIGALLLARSPTALNFARKGHSIYNSEND